MFASREDAGRKLGQYLQGEGIVADLVLGLPRGGVVVASEVALLLHLPLDVLIVRKIGHPWHREFAVGALAEDDVVVLDDSARGGNWLIRGELKDIIQEERERLRDYGARFHPEGRLDLAGKRVLLVDDGLATGATTEAAVLAARKQKASGIIVAVPVASTHALHRLGQVADGVHALIVDPDFEAVGRYYETFTQTTDEQVMDLLKGQGNVMRNAG
jgi:predicted phosphoribosyltransferase